MLDGSQLQVSLLNLEQFCERNVTVSSFSTSVCESKALALESKCILPKTNVLSKVQGSIKDADCSKPEFEEQGEVGMEKHTIPGLKPWQVRFLKTPRMLDRFYKQYLGLVVSVDEERKTAELRAPRDIVKRQFRFRRPSRKSRLSRGPKMWCCSALWGHRSVRAQVKVLHYPGVHLTWVHLKAPGARNVQSFLWEFLCII